MHRSLAKQDKLNEVIILNNFVLTEYHIYLFLECSVFSCLRSSLFGYQQATLIQRNA
jgi:hypothetical protein